MPPRSHRSLPPRRRITVTRHTNSTANISHEKSSTNPSVTAAFPCKSVAQAVNVAVYRPPGKEQTGEPMRADIASVAYAAAGRALLRHRDEPGLGAVKLSSGPPPGALVPLTTVSVGEDVFPRQFGNL